MVTTFAIRRRCLKTTSMAVLICNWRNNRIDIHYLYQFTDGINYVFDTEAYHFTVICGRKLSTLPKYYLRFSIPTQISWSCVTSSTNTLQRVCMTVFVVYTCQPRVTPAYFTLTMTISWPLCVFTQQPSLNHLVVQAYWRHSLVKHWHGFRCYPSPWKRREVPCVL